ncbi:hypothetical protein LP7551_01776 [Roseibium album]|nr:hypothetical protein LP7551_01776 [Roseibium album]
MVERACWIVGKCPVAIVDDGSQSSGHIYCEGVNVRIIDIREICCEEDSSVFIRRVRQCDGGRGVVLASNRNSDGFGR